MTQIDSEEKAKKEAMKKLRQARKSSIKSTAAKVKADNKAIQAIREQLESEARTVPEVAEATGIEASRVLWFVATLKKYGEILEGEKDGSYFRYRLAAGPGE